MILSYSGKASLVSLRTVSVPPLRASNGGTLRLTTSSCPRQCLRQLSKLSSRPAAQRASALVSKERELKPIVKIDNTSDSFATKVTVEYGEGVQELLDTITALKNLNLNIRKAKLDQNSSGKNVFYITDADTSEKIVRSAKLEEIRFTILNTLTTGADGSGAGASVGVRDVPALGERRTVVPTTIKVTEAENGSCSILTITTTDRPGLLVDIVRVLKDINMNVVSAEVDTLGKEAQDQFFVTYHGEPLNSSMVLLVTNALQYYLSLNEVAREESY